VPQEVCHRVPESWRCTEAFRCVQTFHCSLRSVSMSVLSLLLWWCYGTCLSTLWPCTYHTCKV